MSSNSSDFTPRQLREFAERQYVAQWELKYRSWSYAVGNAKLSREQLAAMQPPMEELLAKTKVSGEPLLTRLDRITKWFFVEWLAVTGPQNYLVANRHPLHMLSVKSITDIFARLVAAHDGACRARCQYWGGKALELLKPESSLPGAA